MAKQDKNTLKSWFNTGEYVTQAHCEDWMDSYLHKDEELDILSKFPKLKQVVGQKASKEVLPKHLKNRQQPHKVTQGQVDLGKVNNIADADKPVSKPLENALNQKTSKHHIHTMDAIEGIDKYVNGYSDTTAPSQRAVKNYVAAQLPLPYKKDNGTSDIALAIFPKGELLSTPQNGAWECDGRALYFTSKDTRKSVADEGMVFNNSNKPELYIDVAKMYPNLSAETRKKGLDITIIKPINPILDVSFNDHAVFKLAALVNIESNIHGIATSWNGEYQANVFTEFSLEITNGWFSSSPSGANPYTSLTIASIRAVRNIGLKAIDLPIVTNYIDVPGKAPLSSLMFVGVINHHIFNSTLHSELVSPEIYLRDKANSRALKASEAAFVINMNVGLKGDPGDNNAMYRAKLQKLTINRIN